MIDNSLPKFSASILERGGACVDDDETLAPIGCCVRTQQLHERIQCQFGVTIAQKPVDNDDVCKTSCVDSPLDYSIVLVFRHRIQNRTYDLFVKKCVRERLQRDTCLWRHGISGYFFHDNVRCSFVRLRFDGICPRRRIAPITNSVLIFCRGCRFGDRPRSLTR
ncbi:MAG: hypothetical protein CMN73_15665 [Sphingomonas sp.]|nr:hypothetical protein [Sphingomonas sp.]